MKIDTTIYRGLDVLKFMCAILIIPLHFNPYSHEGWFYLISKALGNLGVPCFFMLSGFFLFSKLNDTPLESQSKTLWRQEWRLLKIFIFWLIPYFFILDVHWIFSNGTITTNLIEYVRHIFFGGSYFFLWYIVSLITALFLCYYTTKLSLSWGITLCCALFIIGTLGNSYSYIFNGTKLNNVISSYNQIFYTTRNGLFFGLPCVYMGALIARYKKKISTKQLWIFVPLAISLFIADLIIYKSIGRRFGNMQPSVIILALALVMLFMQLEFKSIHNRMSLYLRKSSLLIYLIHPLLLGIIPSIVYFEIDYYWALYYHIQIPLITFLAICLSFALIISSNKITILNHIM